MSSEMREGLPDGRQPLEHAWGMNRADSRRLGRLARHKPEWVKKDGYGTICAVCGTKKGDRHG